MDTYRQGADSNATDPRAHLQRTVASNIVARTREFGGRAMQFIYRVIDWLESLVPLIEIGIEG